MIRPIFPPLWLHLFLSSPFLILLQPYWPPRCSSGQAPPAPGLLHFPWSGIVFSLISAWLTLLPPAASRLCCDALFFSVSSSLTLPYIKLKFPPSLEHSLCPFFLLYFSLQYFMNIWHALYLYACWFIIFVFPWECKLHEDREGYSSFFVMVPEWCLAHNRHLINACWNKWM